MRIVTGIVRWFCLGLLWLYRKTVSPLLPASCRFEPTCSRYAEQALRTLPLHRAVFLIVKRILRCQPYCHAPYRDPVPQPDEVSHAAIAESPTAGDAAVVKTGDSPYRQPSS